MMRQSPDSIVFRPSPRSKFAIPQMPSSMPSPPTSLLQSSNRLPTTLSAELASWVSANMVCTTSGATTRSCSSSCSQFSLSMWRPSSSLSTHAPSQFLTSWYLESPTLSWSCSTMRLESSMSAGVWLELVVQRVHSSSSLDGLRETLTIERRCYKCFEPTKGVVIRKKRYFFIAKLHWWHV